MLIRNNFLKNFWKHEWFAFTLVILILFSSYAFYQSFPIKINLIQASFFIPSYLIAFLLPLFNLIVYLYFLLFFKFNLSLNDYYRLRDIVITFLAMIYFSLSLYATSYPINLDFWLFLFLGFFIIYLSSLFLKYSNNKILSKFLALAGFLLALLSILPNYFRWPIISIIILVILFSIFYKTNKS